MNGKTRKKVPCKTACGETVPERQSLGAGKFNINPAKKKDWRIASGPVRSSKATKALVNGETARSGGARIFETVGRNKYLLNSGKGGED